MNNEEQADTEASKYTKETFSGVLPDADNTLNSYEETPTIADLIKQERKRKELSQIDLSGRADVSNVHLSRIERGECNPTIRTLTKLAPFLGYSIETLLAASHYQGELPSDTPTFVDFDGQVINLEQIANFMYHVDGELLLLVHNFYKQYSAADSEVLKILLKSMAECRRITEKEEKTNSKHIFAETFTNLKQFIVSFGKMAHATIAK
ncbi:MAG: helix-turn-helix transcriptional regulator [Lachnospiraceae bacterium]|nr:helix-turn-helix transcriptional regulator [Lachnospiraceae bacterium]